MDFTPPIQCLVLTSLPPAKLQFQIPRYAPDAVSTGSAARAASLAPMVVCQGRSIVGSAFIPPSAPAASRLGETLAVELADHRAVSNTLSPLAFCSGLTSCTTGFFLSPLDGTC